MSRFEGFGTLGGVRRKVIAGVLLVIGGGALILWGWLNFYKKGKAALLVETVPTAQVYVDGELVGKTPYEGETSEKEVVVKLVPESFEKPLSTYETKIRLVSGVKTIVRRVFGEKEEEIYGEEISFEKLGGKNTSVAVVTKPDGAQVYIDGNFKDVAPLKVNEIGTGVYQITVKAEGYNERTFGVQVVVGYGVTAIVDLEKSRERSEAEGEVATTVEVKETPTGFLRVRAEGTTESAEVAQVKPGEEYKLLEKNEEGDWLRIEIEEGKSGWIAAEYASVSAKDTP